MHAGLGLLKSSGLAETGWQTLDYAGDGECKTIASRTRAGSDQQFAGFSLADQACTNAKQS